RILDLSGVIEHRDMRDRYLDNMELERERGITIKAQNVRIPWVPQSGTHEGEKLVLQLIDTPGHVTLLTRSPAPSRRVKVRSCWSTPPRVLRPRLWRTFTSRWIRTWRSFLS